MIGLDLSGKRALVAGVADDAGYGFAISKALAAAGASVVAGTWPPALPIFTRLLERGKLDESRRLPDGSLMGFERIYPLDAMYDRIEEVPTDVRGSKRYRGMGDFSIEGMVRAMVEDFGERPLDIVVHSLANAPEVKNPLMETSRRGYLDAVSASAYSFVSMISRIAPRMGPGGSFLTLSYLAGRRVVPGYGGGMSSAKAALEADTRVLAYEAGRRHDVRVNCISAGPLASRAAGAIGRIDRLVACVADRSPLQESVTAADVAHAAVFLVSPLAAGITGTVLYVDKGFHAMGLATDELRECGIGAGSPMAGDSGGEKR
ncbi:MAG: enoyl-[acyl-carrier-protein] reductase [Desulfobacterales bacterium]